MDMDERFLGCIITVLVALILASAAGGIGTGKVTPNTVLQQETPTGTATPTGDRANNSSDSGLWGFVEGGTDTVGDWVNNGINWADGRIDDGVQVADNAYRGTLKTILNPLIIIIVEVPTFGIGLLDNKPGIHQPTKWPFKGLFPLYVAIQSVTAGIITLVVILGFVKIGSPRQNTYKSTLLAFRAIKALLIAVVFHLLLIALFHNIVNELSIAIAPTSEELAGSFAKVATTSVVSGFFGSNLGKEAIVQLAKMWTLVWTTLMFFPIISPPFFALWQFDPRSTLGSISGTIIWLYIGLLISKLLVAVDLRAAWMLDWSLSPFGALNVLVTIAFFWLAFFIPPGVLIAILFSRSRGFGMMTSTSVGAASGSYFGSRASDKGRIRQSIESSVNEKKQSVKDRAQSTAQNTKKRAAHASAKLTNERVGRYRHPKFRERRWNDEKESPSDLSSVSAWQTYPDNSSTSSNGTTASSGASSGASSSTKTTKSDTKTVAQEIRELKLKGHTSGWTVEDRVRYHQLKDEQRYGEEIERQQMSGAKRSAYRRYSSDKQRTGARTSTPRKSATSRDERSSVSNRKKRSSQIDRGDS